MKTFLKKIVKPLLAVGLSLSVVAVTGVTVSAAKKEPVESNAYYSPSAHYEVSDTASELASYYSSISDSDTGSSLLSKLQSLNSSKRKRTIGYGGIGTNTSGACIYTDYDLNSTATDSNGQTYGTKVASFYTKTAATGWNREHMWPNSHGGNHVEADILHTRPTISSENSSRGNSFYVEGKNSSSAGWDPYTAGYDAEVRGECARVILYCVVAYPSFTLSDADSHSTSNSNKDNMMGNMNTLIKWHFDYMPNVYEMNRNNGAEYLQGNRNPFVDHPEYVAKIWSNFNSTVSTLCTNNSTKYSNWTPGAYANYGENTPVNTAGVTISNSSMSITNGKTATISATSSNNGNISWSTSNSSVVSISSSSAASGSSITLTAEALGTATITASVTISGTQYTKTCTVTVTAPKTLSSISVSDQKTSFVVGSSFSFEGTVTANYTDSTSSNVTSSATFSGYNMSLIGSQTVTVSYTEGNTTKTTTYTITVAAAGQSGNFDQTYSYSDLSRWSLTNYTSQSGYLLCPNTSDTTSVALFSHIFNDKTITSNVVITIHCATYGSGSSPTSSTFTTYTSNACTTQVTAAQSGTLPTSSTYTDAIYTITKSNAQTFVDDLAIKITKPGRQIRLQSIRIVFDYTTASSTTAALSSISLNTDNVTKTFAVGSTFSYTGLVVTAHYSDESSATVTPTSVSSPNMSTTGEKTVTVTYTESDVTKTATYTITVNAAAKTLSSISISGQTTSFTVDDTFSFGGTVTAHFSDSSSSNVTASATFSGYNMSVAGNYTITVSYTYSGTTKTATYSITVQSSGGSGGQTTESFDKVTSTSEITAGTYLIVFETNSVAFDGGLTTLDATSNTISVTISNNKIEATTETKAAAFTIATMTGGFSICSASGKYIGRSANSNGLDAGTSAVKNTISISNNNAVITAEGNTTLRFNNENGQKRFRYYKSGQQAIQFYKLVESSAGSSYGVNDWVSEFLSDITCDSTGVNAPVFITSWSAFKTSYGTLSSTDQNTLKTAVSKENGTDIQKAVYKYDYIIAKYGTTTYENFIGRNAMQLGYNMSVFAITNSGSMTPIIVITSLASVAAIGALVFIKKRKED